MDFRKFEIRHSDGTVIIVKATNEEMARQFAMTKKYGPAIQNKTFPMSGEWRGNGLSVKEIYDAKA